MLKKLTLDYYYSNISVTNAPMTFDNVCFSMRAYLKGAEYKKDFLLRWNETILRSVMAKSENKKKSMEEYLQLLIKNLRYLQHGLNIELQSDKFIYNKFIVTSVGHKHRCRV